MLNEGYTYNQHKIAYEHNTLPIFIYENLDLMCLVKQTKSLNDLINMYKDVTEAWTEDFITATWVYVYGSTIPRLIRLKDTYFEDYDDLILINRHFTKEITEAYTQLSEIEPVYTDSRVEKYNYHYTFRSKSISYIFTNLPKSLNFIEFLYKGKYLYRINKFVNDLINYKNSQVTTENYIYIRIESIDIYIYKQNSHEYMLEYSTNTEKDHLKIVDIIYNILKPYEIISEYTKVNYNIYIPSHFIDYNIFLDMCLNDKRFSILYIHDSREKKRKLLGVYKNFIDNYECNIKISNKTNDVEYTSSTSIYVKISLVNVEISWLDRVKHDMFSMIYIYNIDYKKYEKYYINCKGFKPYINTYVNETNSFVVSKYTKKAPNLPTFVKSINGLNPKRFAVVNRYDFNGNLMKEKYIAYCNETNYPYIRWILNDMDPYSKYPYLLVCRSTPFIVEKRLESTEKVSTIIIKHMRFVQEDQRGVLPEVFDTFLEICCNLDYDDCSNSSSNSSSNNKNKTKNKSCCNNKNKHTQYYRYGTSTTVTNVDDPIYRPSEINPYLGVTEPHESKIIRYDLSLISSILYAINKHNYQTEFSSREEILLAEIDELNHKYTEKIYKLDENLCNNINILEDIYQIRIIVLERERIESVSSYRIITSRYYIDRSLCNYKDNNKDNKKDNYKDNKKDDYKENNKDNKKDDYIVDFSTENIVNYKDNNKQNVCLIYLHTGGVWDKLSCELIIDENYNTLFEMPALSRYLERFNYFTIKPNILIDRANYQYIQDNTCIMLFYRFNQKFIYCFCSGLRILNIPLIDNLTPYKNKIEVITDFLGDIEYIQDEHHISIDIDNITYKFPIYKKYNTYTKHKEMRNYSYLLREHCFYRYSRHGYLYNISIDDSKIPIDIDINSLTNKPLDEITVLPIELSDSFNITINSHQNVWINQQIEMDLRSFDSHIEYYKLKNKNLCLNNILYRNYKVYKNIVPNIPHMIYKYIIFKPIQLFLYNNITFICTNKDDMVHTKNILICNNNGIIISHIITPALTDDYSIVYKNEYNTLKYLKMVVYKQG